MSINRNTGGVTAPIIEDDGSVIVVSKVRVSTRYVHSWIGQDGLCHFDTSPQDFSLTATAYVNELGPDGTLDSHVIDDPDAARSLNLQTISSDNYMLPDGHGGCCSPRARTRW